MKVVKRKPKDEPLVGQVKAKLRGAIERGGYVPPITARRPYPGAMSR